MTLKKARSKISSNTNFDLIRAVLIPAIVREFILPLLGLSLILTPVSSNADTLRGIYRNNLGVRSENEKKSLEAYRRFNSALVDLPFAPEVHYNLGNSFLENKEFDKAISEYRQALKLTHESSRHDRSLRFLALFNSGVAMAEQKKVDEALGFYQAALEYEPDSIETKTNIELLAQQGGGQGEGEGKDQKPNKDGKDPKNQKPKPDGKDQKPQDPQKQEPPKPKPFQSKELNQQDVNRILEELKRQEDSIREKMQKEGPKDAPLDKDW